MTYSTSTPVVRQEHTEASCPHYTSTGIEGAAEPDTNITKVFNLITYCIISI
jgi:hypothetical protein